MGAIAEYARKKGSSLNELSVLIPLRYHDSAKEAHHRGCTQQEICLRSPFLPKQTVNSIVKKLEREGKVVLEVSKSDSRMREIVLTPIGRVWAAEVLDAFVEAGEQTVDTFSDRDFLTLLQFTRQFDLQLEQSLGVPRIGSAIDLPENPGAEGTR